MITYLFDELLLWLSSVAAGNLSGSLIMAGLALLIFLWQVSRLEARLRSDMANLRPTTTVINSAPSPWPALILVAASAFIAGISLFVRS